MTNTYSSSYFNESVESMDEAINSEILDKSVGKHGIFLRGGSIGSRGDQLNPDFHFTHGKLVAVHDDHDEAKDEVKRRNKGLSRGEKSYYKMRYHTKPLTLSIIKVLKSGPQNKALQPIRNESTIDLLNSINSGDTINSAQLFNDALMSKVSELIDLRRQEVAQSMFEAKTPEGHESTQHCVFCGNEVHGHMCNRCHDYKGVTDTTTNKKTGDVFDKETGKPFNEDVNEAVLDKNGQEIKAGHTLTWKERGEHKIGKVVADKTYNGGLRIGGRSVHNINDEHNDLKIIED